MDHLLDTLTTRRAIGRRLLVAALACGLLTSTRSLQSAQTTGVAAAVAPLTDLRSIDELKALFNRDVGKVRLVLLLSPT